MDTNAIKRRGPVPSPFAAASRKEYLRLRANAYWATNKEAAERNLERSRQRAAEARAYAWVAKLMA